MNELDVSKRFRKGDLEGNELLFNASQWATVTDTQTGLMWMNDWDTDDGFVGFPVTWFQTKDAYCQSHYNHTWNNGFNTEILIDTINNAGWAGLHDWRLPTLDELKTLLLPIEYTDKTEFDKTNYDQLFSNVDKNIWFWSCFSNTYNASTAWGVNFEDGYAHYGGKYINGYVRAVRAG